jgi:hypothetical protein
MNNGTSRPLEFNVPHNSLKDELCKRTLELATVAMAWLPNALSGGLFKGLRFPRFSSARWLAAPSNPFNKDIIGRCQCPDCVTQTNTSASRASDLGLVACLASEIDNSIMSPLAMYSREFQAALPIFGDKQKDGVAFATTTLHLALAIVGKLGHHGDPGEHLGSAEVFRHPLIEAWMQAAPIITQPLLRETQLCVAGFVSEVSAVDKETGELDVAYCQSLSSMLRYAAAQWAGPPIVRDAHSMLLEPFARMRLGHMRQQAREDAPLPMCAMAHDILAASALVAFVELESDVVCYGRGNRLCYDEAHDWFACLVRDLEAASRPFIEAALSPPWPYGTEFSTEMTLVPSVPDIGSSPPSAPLVLWMSTGDRGGDRITTTSTTTVSVPVARSRKRTRDGEDAICPTSGGMYRATKRQRLARCPQ